MLFYILLDELPVRKYGGTQIEYRIRGGEQVAHGSVFSLHLLHVEERSVHLGVRRVWRDDQLRTTLLSMSQKEEGLRVSEAQLLKDQSIHTQWKNDFSEHSWDFSPLVGQPRRTVALSWRPSRHRLRLRSECHLPARLSPV